MVGELLSRLCLSRSSPEGIYGPHFVLSTANVPTSVHSPSPLPLRLDFCDGYDGCDLDPRVGNSCHRSAAKPKQR